ncbi:MAG: hypothetical protein CSA68_08260 [Rhodobacterales bacterium]|nr:MAG: hypothetical protein CSA68_08260 [Rhodobacterales bacterium]
MSVYLPKEVEEGLKKARRQGLRRKNRLRVHTGDEVFPVLRFWETGFALDLENAPHLRGFVDIFDGGKHLYQCLVVASEENQDEMIYEFKRSTVAKDKAPLDFARDANAPVALIEG